jgi:hypothetical protein
VRGNQSAGGTLPGVNNVGNDEVTEVGVFEHTSEFAGGPEFRSGGIGAFDELEQGQGAPARHERVRACLPSD